MYVLQHLNALYYFSRVVHTNELYLFIHYTRFRGIPHKAKANCDILQNVIETPPHANRIIRKLKI